MIQIYCQVYQLNFLTEISGRRHRTIALDIEILVTSKRQRDVSMDLLEVTEETLLPPSKDPDRHRGVQTQSADQLELKQKTLTMRGIIAVQLVSSLNSWIQKVHCIQIATN